jgi:aconitate hydratase
MSNGDVVIASITSCTNTSNPSVMIGAGILAKKAIEKGLNVKPWVKTSLAPGSKVVTEYLKKAGLVEPLEKLGFHIVAYGCTTCIGNSGPLPDEVSTAVKDGDLVVTSVLSGNRNFEGRINPLVKANYLASPPLVVAYALAGKMDFDWEQDTLTAADGSEVSLKDIWPTSDEVSEMVNSSLESSQFESQYGAVFEGSQEWQDLDYPRGERYLWDEQSSYVKQPPFFTNLSKEPSPVSDIQDARCLVLLGDSVTTDHISPAGAIAEDSPAGKYLQGLGIDRGDFNSYGSRRGNHEVMMRGTFANIRLRNELAPGTEGSWTRKLPEGKQMSIFDASMEYQKSSTPLVVIAGKEYGTGSSRDWAAKGTTLLGVKAVIAESFERIHRSNLIGMGVLPLQFKEGDSKDKLGLDGEETFSITGITGGFEPGQTLAVTANKADGESISFDVLCRIDTLMEYNYYEHGGILQYVLRSLLSEKD